MRRCFLGFLALFALLSYIPTFGAETLPYFNPCSSLDGMTPDILTSQSKNWTAEKRGHNYTYSVSPRNSNTTQDAYLWLPAINFEYEHCYRFAIDTKTLYSSTKGRFRLVMATSPSRNNIIKELMPATEVGSMFAPHDSYFTPETTQELYLGIQVTSPGSASTFYVDNILVEEVAANVPAKITNFTATSHTGGIKKIDLSMTAPGKNVLGGTARSLSKIELYCDGMLIHTIASPKPNSVQNYTYQGSVSGEHLFTARAFSSGGAGSMAYVMGNVGPQIPNADYYYKRSAFWYKATAIYDQSGKINLTWNPREGAETAKYNVYRMPENIKVASQLTDTVFSEDAPISNEALALWYRLEAEYPDSIKEMCNSSAISIYNPTPFISLFSQANMINEFTVFDVNKGGGWWGYSTVELAMGVRNNDDWLVTPGILLKPGKIYKVTAEVASSYRPVFYSVAMGRTNDYKYLDKELIPYTRVESTTGETEWSYFTVPEESNYFIGIHSYNKDEPDNVNSMWLNRIDIEEVDGSLPLAVEDLKAVYSDTDATKAKVRMTLPTRSFDGSTISTLTKVELYKDEELIDTKYSLAAGSVVEFDITIDPGTLYKYRAVPFTASGEGESKELDVMIVRPYYFNDFTEKTSTEGFTIIDPDHDANTWGWHNSLMRSYPEINNGSDDWLVTPAIHLEAGKYYRTEMLVSCEEEAIAPNVVTTYLGSEPTIEAMKTTVVKPYIVKSVGYNQFALLKDYFTVEKTGAYYLGVHSECPSGSYGSSLLLDDFTISSKINGEVPDTVTNFIIAPNMDGELYGEVKFKTPTLALNGTQLSTSEVMKVYVYVDGVALPSLDALPGENIGVPISFEEQGVHLVTVICTNSYGQGREREDIGFFGINRPGNPLNLKVNENPEKVGEVIISWEHNPNDWDGFPINPEHITYEVIDLTGNSETTLITGLKDTSWTYQARRPDQDQSFMRFAVRAWTVTAGSQGVYAPYIAVGSPYTLPLTESFPNYNPRMTMIQQSPDGENLAMWGFNNSDPSGSGCYDNDNGMALMEAIFAGATKRLVTGKIDLSDVEKPILSVRVYNNTGINACTNLLEFQVSTGLTREEDWKSVAVKSIDEWAEGERGWQRMEIDLSEFKGQVVYVGIVGTAMSHAYTCFDAFELAEAKQKNLGVTNTYQPEEVYVGQDFEITARIRNHGHSAAEGYKVSLLKNDETIRTLDGVKLNPGERHDFIFTECVNRDKNDHNTYNVIVLYEGDEDTFDNTSKKVQINVLDNEFPPVGNLSGSQHDGNNVKLQWETPEIPSAAQEITDDVESYASWSTMHTGIGNYTLYDVDDMGIAGISGIDLPVAINSKQSWFVFDRTIGTLETHPIADAHSGIKYFACMATYSPGYFANDVLVSPELSGEEQTISFYARAYTANYRESFEVLMSDSKKIESILQEKNSLGFNYDIPTEWTKYEYRLPAGTKYFAIRRYTASGFMMFVDDLTYTPAGNERLSLRGYNVYLDGSKVNDLPISGNEYFHTPKSGDHTYGVSAVYNLGESPLSEVIVSFLGVDGISNESVKVIGGKGEIIIEGAAGFETAIYAADGKCIYAGINDESRERIAATAGVYVINISGKAVKVIVR